MAESTDASPTGDPHIAQSEQAESTRSAPPRRRACSTSAA